MIQVRRAKRSDIPAVTTLMNCYRKMSVDPSLINPRDIALVAEIDGEVVGFAFCGLMAGNTLGYVDRVVVRPDAEGKHVLRALYRELAFKIKKMGVRQIFGIIQQDQYHDRALVAAAKMGMKAATLPYTYILTDVAHAWAELQDLGVL